MATLNSYPATLMVRTPVPVQNQFGNGSETGSINGDVWTPGRDGAGAVNAVSWDLVPLRRGVRVAGTQLQSLGAVVEQAVPGWRDWGVEGWKGVTDAWNGFTIDTAGSRLWLMAAGIYRFDAFRMAWAVEKLPSDPAPWSVQYRALKSPQAPSYTRCWESEQAQAASQAAGVWSPINDWFQDELFWDNRPTSRHIYSASAYAPDSNELIMSNRRFWRYSITAGEWTYRRVLDDGRRAFAGSINWATYDEVAGEYLLGGSGDASYSTVGYRLNNNTWTNWSAPWAIYSVVDARHGRTWTMFQTPEQAGGVYASIGRYWQYDLDRRSVVASGSVQFADDLPRSAFPPFNWYYFGAGMCYVPPLDRYWVCTRLADGTMQILELDPSTTPWTLRRAPAIEGNTPTPHPNLCRRFVYLPGLNAVIMGHSADEDMWLYRF
jgi:hypothetical protein